jgi:WD40 repeat protein
MMPRTGLLVLLVGLLAAVTRADQPSPGRDRHGDPLPEGVLARLGTVRLRGGDGGVVAYSADGSLLASGNARRGVTVWNATTGLPVGLFKDARAKEDSVLTYMSLAFSADGRFLAAASVEGFVDVWSVPDGALMPPVPGLGSVVWSVAFTPDSRQLVVVSAKAILLVDPATGTTTRSWAAEPGRRFHPGALSADGTLLAVVGGKSDGSPEESEWVHLLDLATGEELWRIDCEAFRLRIALRPDGRMLALLRQRSVILLDPRTGTELDRWTVPNEDEAGDRSLVFSPDSTLLVVWGHLYHVASGKALRPIGWSAGRGVRSAAISPDGRHLAVTRSTFAGVEIQDVFSGAPVSHAGHLLPVEGMQLLPDGKTFATTSDDGTIRLWNPRTGEQLRKIEVPGLAQRVLAGRWFIQTRETQAELGDLTTGQVVRRFPLGILTASLALSADGQTLLAEDGGGNAFGTYPRVVDTTTGRVRGWLKLDDLNGPASLSPDGTVAATADQIGAIRLWDAVAGRLLFELEKGNREQFRQLARVSLSPDGKVVASWRKEEGTLRLWDVASGQLLRECPTARGKGIVRLTFSPDGRMLAMVEADRTIHVREVVSLQDRFHRAGDGIVAFAGNGLLAVAEDTDVLVHDLAALAMAARASRSWDGATLWADLVEPGVWSYRALRVLVATPERAVPLLDAKLRPVSSPDPERVRRWIADLDAEDFDTRERASAELILIAAQIEPTLVSAHDTAASVEQRRRLAGLLPLPGRAISPERLRVLRAIEALEEIGTADARTILERLSKGESSALETQHARAALQRLGGQP